MIRVVRSDGSVETDWKQYPVSEHANPSYDRVLIYRGWMTKAPSKRVFDCWQADGVCRSTQDHDTNCKV